ncbi:polysaccharide lyase family 7 protein [Flavivirga eckloniae]|uniref:F5/8 type C domain-containing protein n=1 Tax=Flavivirga eckloniae TaxID=1803846 RepID=A0A2K9PT90_9FLAO|nr:polysaccharide lyase family 7 protein [Flavivirga eckloniae]AUP80283.1 hypothetical protein C1H87_16850 [Flavivirga eckloniae]
MKKNLIFLSKRFYLNTLCFALLLLATNCSKEGLTQTPTNGAEEVLEETKTPSTAKSSKSVKMAITGIWASASQNSTHTPDKAIDGNNSTRWTANGTVYLYVDLGASQKIDYAKVSHFKGNSRRYTMKFHVRNSTNASWSLVGTKTSPGTTNSLYDYDLVNSTNRYLRITCTGNTANGYSNIQELQVWGTPADGGGGGGGGGGGSSAKDILGGLTNWKLNAYSGNLNVSSNNNGLSYVDNASKNDNSDWFYGSNGYAYFKTYPGNPTSGGSSNPRTELREMTSNGSSRMYWDGTTSTEHKMKWTIRVEDLPPSGKLCFGQIHSRGSFDDLIRVQVQGSNGQNSGSVKLRLLGYATEELLGGGQTVDFDFRMDRDYSFELTMKNKKIRLYALNSSGSRTRTLFTSGSINSDENYFKAGCYLQSTKNSHKNSSVYGLVGMSSITVSH